MERATERWCHLTLLQCLSSQNDPEAFCGVNINQRYLGRSVAQSSTAQQFRIGRENTRYMGGSAGRQSVQYSNWQIWVVAKKINIGNT